MIYNVPKWLVGWCCGSTCFFVSVLCNSLFVWPHTTEPATPTRRMSKPQQAPTFSQGWPIELLLAQHLRFSMRHEKSWFLFAPFLWVWLPSGKLSVCYWKWQTEIVDLAIKNGAFPQFFVRLPEGMSRTLRVHGSSWAAVTRASLEWILWGPWLVDLSIDGRKGSLVGGFNPIYGMIIPKIQLPPSWWFLLWKIPTQNWMMTGGGGGCFRKPPYVVSWNRGTPSHHPF